MKILFLIRDLNIGGAQRQLTYLAQYLHQKGHEVHVAAFYAHGPFYEVLETAGVRVHSLNKRHRWDVVGFWSSFQKVLQKVNPDILHGYMPESNLIVAMTKLFGPKRVKRVFGVRASSLDHSKPDWLEKLVIWIEGKMAGFADLIIANSKAGAGHSLDKGFPKDRLKVVQNGTDIATYLPNPKRGANLKKTWGGNQAKLIGMVARIDHFKGHTIFLRSASHLLKSNKNLRFIIVGDGKSDLLQHLKQEAKTLGVQDYVVWAGRQSDTAAVYNALDVVCLPSLSTEGVPNVLIEALAVGVPVVASDVGDIKDIVKNYGWIVPPGNVEAFSLGILEALKSPLSSERRHLYIKRSYSIEQLGQKTERLLEALCAA